jgi:hypothetical protein
MTFGVRMAPDSNPGKWAKPRRRFFKRRGAGSNFRKIQSIKFLLTRDRTAVLKFLAAKYPFDFSRGQGLRLLKDFINITNNMRGYYTLAETLTVCDRIFRRGDNPDLVLRPTAIRLCLQSSFFRGICPDSRVLPNLIESARFQRGPS